jgi:hypothetical protein
MGSHLVTAFGPKSIERIRAEDAMKKGKPGDTINREEMALIIGVSCEPRSKGEAAVRRAVRHLETNGGPFWEWSRSDKLWRCLDARQSTTTLHRRQGISRRRNIRILKASSGIDQSQLNEEGKRDLSLLQLQCAFAAKAAGSEFGGKLKQLGMVDGLRLPDDDKLIGLMKNGKS